MANSSSVSESLLDTGTGGLIAVIHSLWTLFLSFPVLRDGVKLFIVGGALESARRLLFAAWVYFTESFFITAEFDDRDETFTWIMFWLSRQPGWNKSRNVRVGTFKYGQSEIAHRLAGDEEGRSNAQICHMVYAPAHNKTLYMSYKGSWMSVTRSKTQGDLWNRTGDERLTITLFTRKISKFDGLLLEAKRTFKKESEGRVNIYVSDVNNEWTLASSRPKRPLSSVVLDKGVKEHLLADAKDFMSNEKWYTDRGIPWRRGYLFHGCPGSGKTSLIYSLAGELDLDIYVISLSKKNLDDSTLNELISRLPSSSLALMEDIDAAFFRGVTREGNIDGIPTMSGHPTDAPMPTAESAGPSTTSVTLSGLLGAIDGVAAQEGRLLFATTNKYAALDPALVRPGRLDVHVRFDNAGRAQAAEMFRCFFRPTPCVCGDEKPEDDSDEADNIVVADEDREGQNEESSEDGVKPVVISPPGPSFRHSFAVAGRGDVKPPSAIYKVDTGAHCPQLTRREVNNLAREFAARVPEGEFSMAAIQGLLMQYKTRPYLVVDEVGSWVAEERQKRAEREGKSVEVRESPSDTSHH